MFGKVLEEALEKLFGRQENGAEMFEKEKSSTETNLVRLG